MKPPAVCLLLLAGLALAGLPRGLAHQPSEPAHEPDHGAEAITTPAHDAGDHEEDASGVTFHQDSGLTFDPAVLANLDLHTATASRQELTHRRQLTGQVYLSEGETLVCLQVPADEAGTLAGGAFKDARLRRVDRQAAAATGWVDFIVAPASATAPAPGDFTTVIVEWRDTPSAVIPASALLDTAEGRFVYVRHDYSWRRTPVTIGPRSDDSRLLGVTSGLQPGDTVLVSPVTTFWLTELRLTKGGGHSH